jgi:hypothetical protein
MVIGIPEALRNIAELDEKMDKLQDEMDTYTYPLEQAAMAYHRANPRNSFPSRLSCARCYFVFQPGRQTADEVVFGTDCSWCGPNSGDGLRVQRVHVQRLEPFMQ